VNVDSEISVKLLKDGNDWAGGITVAGKDEYKGTDGCYYFPLEDFTGADLSSVDAVGVAFNTTGVEGTINSIQFVEEKQ
jgi:hypothetical protein